MSHEIPIQKCERCGVPIMMIEHYRTARRAPIEVQPTSDGNILITDHLYQVIGKKELRQSLQAAGHQLRKNHFATCPYAIDFHRV
jgi:hypothetical protein